MKKRFFLAIACAAGLLMAPLPSPATVGADLTLGRISVNFCLAACSDPGFATIAMTGTYVISGKIFVGTMSGTTAAHYSADYQRRIIDPFTLTGVSDLGSTVAVSCKGIDFRDESRFKVVCGGNVSGVSGSRTVSVRAMASNSGCSCDERRINGFYQGV